MRNNAIALLLAVTCLAEQTYRQALPGWKYEFPRDHFDHPEFRTEWWYYTGNVQTSTGRRFGYELTFFRHGVDGSKRGDHNVWEIKDAWMAHFALSDIGAKRFLHTERLTRQGPGIAGVDFAKRTVWNGNWHVRWTDDQSFQLRAVSEQFSVQLELRLAKPPVIHGENGISRKAAGEGRASHYVSLTRLETTGSIKVNGQQFPVTGQSWMDHEWFTHSLTPDQTGWDWFSLQFDDGSELMLYRLRRRDGTVEPHSSGTYVDASGRARHLRLSEFSLIPGRTWRSPVSKASYPVEWAIRVPSLRLELALRPLLNGQELAGKSKVSPVYWEGAVEVHGSGRHGRGYLEMSGYAGALRMGE
ncbi:MAG TPA: lipocalin-like domain-containing protein [Bryobacteraceae bacterium]|nr:lipocalin-like domain-containing protein [Bryobacteraceae bacterium]